MTDGERQNVTTHQAEVLARRFDTHRPRLLVVANRMLGSPSEAEDAVQECWLRANRAGTDHVENLGGWLTTVVGRVCLDMLRSRKARREEPLGVRVTALAASRQAGLDPEREALVTDSLRDALQVVLDTLTPAERLVYVLHDVFAVPFEQIAPIAGRTPVATRKLASRARRRILESPVRPDADPRRQWQAVQAFLDAARGGDFDALVAILDPDVVVRADVPKGVPRQARGPSSVAEQALAYATRAEYAHLALIDGTMGIVVAPHGRVTTALAITVRHGKIVHIDVIATKPRLTALALTPLH